MTSFEKPNHFIKVNLIVVVYCSSIKHPTRHITTWESMYNTIDANKKTQKIKVFNQIDYIICRTAKKSILQKTPSYAGTEMSNDHRLPVTKMRIERFYLYKKNKVKFDALIDTNRLQREEVQRNILNNYKKNLKKSRRRSAQMTRKIGMISLRRS